MMFVVGLEGWFGHDRVWLVEDHLGWRRVPAERSVVVLSAGGLWRDDERLADAAGAEQMSWADIDQVYSS